MKTDEKHHTHIEKTLKTDKKTLQTQWKLMKYIYIHCKNIENPMKIDEKHCKNIEK